MRNPLSARAALGRAALPVVVAVPLLVGDARPAVAQSYWGELGTNEWTCTITFTVCGSQGVGDWPVLRNQMMFESGFMAAGVVAHDAGFDWAGERGATWMYDPRGIQRNAFPITDVWDSSRPDELEAWPRHGEVPGAPDLSAWPDNELIHPIYYTQPVVSEEDVWTALWDGGSRDSAPGIFGRDLPLGVVVTQRAMVWNHPWGNQATIYLLYEVTNATNDTLFRRNVAHQYFDDDVDAVPASGWRIDSLYVAFGADPDVTTDGTTNSAQMMPWARGAVAWYATPGVEPFFEYPPDVYHLPFRPNEPGLVATALVWAPPATVTGAEPFAMSSVTLNPGSCNGQSDVCDPVGAATLWRFLSGNFDAQEALRCHVDHAALHACMNGFDTDIRMYQSAGPYNLQPGETLTVVYAIVAAPVLDVPEFDAYAAPTQITMHPGCHGEAPTPLDLAAGWQGVRDCPPAGQLADPADVIAAPGSLLHRIQIARAFASGGFVTPFAPDPPEFHLVPADTMVTVVWSRSPTETSGSGDPWYGIAQDSTSALHNPNYRAQDVEGYRIYRSTDGQHWSLRAQFDYDSTVFVDVLCETDEDHVAGAVCADTVAMPIYDDLSYYGFNQGMFVQYRPGDILASSTGQPIVVDGDTASAGYQPLGDFGPEFAFTDSDVRAGFRYFYQVRAFDVNSHRSGPSSLESGARTKSIVVQAEFANLAEPSVTSFIAGADGEPLDLGAELPEIDSATGVFNGPMPPTNALELTFRPLVSRLLPDFRLEVRIDSVRLGPGAAAPCTAGTDQLGACWRLFYTTNRDGVASTGFRDGYTPVWDALGGVGEVALDVAAVDLPADADALEDVDAAPDAFTFTAAVQASLDESIFNSASEGQLNRRAGGSGIPASVHVGGSRWFDGTAETVPHPTRGIRVGHLDGVDTVWAPIHHTTLPGGGAYPASASMQCYSYAVSGIARAADIQVTWDGNSIRAEDVTHHVSVPFSPVGQQSWGFVRDGNGNGMIDWQDFDYVAGIAPAIRQNPFCTQPTAAEETSLSSTAVILPVSTDGVESGFTSSGSGFGLYINAQRFIFETNGALPADGTVWTLRSYHGYVTASTDVNTATPSGYQYQPDGPGGLRNIRPPMVPGLRVVFEGTAARLEGAPDLARVHTVPDPFYFHSAFGSTAQDRGRVIRFVNLPPSATIRIYSLTGILVDVIHHDDPLSGIATWDLKTRDGNTAAPGVYLYHVSAADAEEHIGRFTIVTSGQYFE